MRLPTTAPNRVVLVLGLIAALLFSVLDFGTIQPNRIVEGTPFGAWQALGGGWFLVVWAGFLVVLALAVMGFRGRYRLLAGLLVAMLAAQPWLLADFLSRHLGVDAPYGRGSMAAGFWSVLFLLSLMLVETLRQLNASRLARTTMVLAIAAGWLLVVHRGALDALSVVTEYTSRPEQFLTALLDHLALTAGAVLISLIMAFALALRMIRHERWRKPVFAVVSFLQTIPSLALFGLLIAPLSALSSALPLLQELGIRGVGWAPALIALVAYSLLPMVRNIFVALTEVSPDLLEAARGMGMSRRQVFRQVRLPLAMPIIIEGVRITTIQATGLTAVAALIGAGGFGTFIFQGLGQAAMDLVLLGALPTVALALLADGLFTALGHAFRPAGGEAAPAMTATKSSP